MFGSVPGLLLPRNLLTPEHPSCSAVTPVPAERPRTRPGTTEVEHAIGPWALMYCATGPLSRESAGEMTVKVKSFYLFQERTRQVDLNILYENRQTENRTK